jgi:hypothetical protein
MNQLRPWRRALVQFVVGSLLAAIGAFFGVGLVVLLSTAIPGVPTFFTGDVFYVGSVVSAALAYGLISAKTEFRETINEDRMRDSKCLRCGYDLRGSSKRCPECGTAISVAQERQLEQQKKYAGRYNKSSIGLPNSKKPEIDGDTNE